jgi:hypothetical protein
MESQLTDLQLLSESKLEVVQLVPLSSIDAGLDVERRYAMVWEIPACRSKNDDTIEVYYLR